MKLVLDITTEAQKKDIMQLADRLHVPVEVLDVSEEEDDNALVQAIYANAKDDILSLEEKNAFLAYLAK